MTALEQLKARAEQLDKEISISLARQALGISNLSEKQEYFDRFLSAIAAQTLKNIKNICKRLDRLERPWWKRLLGLD